MKQDKKDGRKKVSSRLQISLCRFKPHKKFQNEKNHLKEGWIYEKEKLELWSPRSAVDNDKNCTTKRQWNEITNMKIPSRDTRNFPCFRLPPAFPHLCFLEATDLGLFLYFVYEVESNKNNILLHTFAFYHWSFVKRKNCRRTFSPRAGNWCWFVAGWKKVSCFCVSKINKVCKGESPREPFVKWIGENSVHFIGQNIFPGKHRKSTSGN